MKKMLLLLATVCVTAATSLPAAAQAPGSAPAAPSRPATPTTPARPAESAAEAEASIESRYEAEVWRREVLRIGQDFTLSPGDMVREVVVLAGDGVIEGRVEQDVVVILGKVRIAGTAVINGSLIVVGGSASIASGAVVDRDLVVVGASFDAPSGFMPGGQQVVIGPAVIGGRLQGLVPWIARGLFLGRPIVPDLSWVWGVVGLVFLVYVAVTLLLHQPVRASAGTLAARPLTSFVVGLVVMLLTGPVCLLMAVSVFGIVVIPFFICALVVAWIVGKVGVMLWIGRIVVRQEPSDSRFASLLPFAAGFAMLSIAYMVPLIGFMVWTMVGVFGLGAASLAFISAYRRENPAPAPRNRWFELGHRSPSTTASAPGAAAMAEGGTPSAFQDTGASPPADAASPASFTAVPPAPPYGTHGGAADLAMFPHAGFWERLGAFVLDVILVVVVREVLDIEDHDGPPFLLLLAYHIGFWTWKGTTIGGIICQLRVVRADGAPLGFADATIRGVASILSLAVLGLGGLWILRDPERQAWHDRIAGTYVVKVPRNWPI